MDAVARRFLTTILEDMKDATKAIINNDFHHLTKRGHRASNAVKFYLLDSLVHLPHLGWLIFVSNSLALPVHEFRSSQAI